MTPTRGWASSAAFVCFAAMLCVWCEATAATADPPQKPAGPAVAKGDADRWKLEVTPYIFVPEITADIKAGGVKASSKLSMGDVVDDLQMGGLLRVELMKGRWGLYIDGEYLNLADEIDGPEAYKDVDIPAAIRNSGVDAKAALKRLGVSRADVRKAIANRLAGRLPPGMTPEQAKELAKAVWSRLTPSQKAAALKRIQAAFAGAKGAAAAKAARLKSALGALTLPHIDEVDVDLTAWLIDVGAFYRLIDRPLPYRYVRHVQCDLMAGARYVYMKTKVDIDFVPGSLGLFPTSYKSESSKDWVDPVIGARTRVALTDKLLFSVRGDIGGFGIGSASDFTWQVVAGLGYRLTDRTTLSAGYRQFEVDYKSGDDMELDMTLKGPFLGCTIRF